MMIRTRISSKTSFRTAAVLWIGLLLLARPGAGSPPEEALVRGTIQDAAGAQVTARNLASGETHSASTGTDGRFEIAQLPPGAYRVEIAADRAELPEPQQVELTSGESRALAFVLGASPQRGDTGPPGEQFPEIGRQVEETPSPAAIPSGNLIQQTQLVGLPLNGRSYSQLATLQSDVSDTAAGSASRGTGGGNLTMAGGRSNSNNFLLDGTGIMNAENQAPRSAAGVQLGSEAVFQVQVLSSYYGAEYGRSSGGVLNSITRSGTPQFHGTLFEYFRNSKLDARNFYDNEAEPPPFKRNQFGFTLTGPIVPEKTFFMASFEAMRDRLSETAVNFFPDEGARVGDLGDGRIVPVSPRVRPYLDLYPIPNDIRLGRGIGRNLAPQFQPTNESFLTVRVDQRLSDRDRFFVRYTFDDASSRTPDAAYLFQTIKETRQQYLTLVASHTFSPQSLTSFRFGYTRPVLNEDDISDFAVSPELFFVPGATRFGQFKIPGLSNFGPDGGLPGGSILNSFQFSDDVFLQRGLHAVKLGFEVHRYRSDVFNSWGKYGWWDFNSLESFLQAGPDGTNLYVARPGSDNHHAYRQTLAGFYVQDQYRLRPNLQLGLGLRYEFATQLQDNQNRLAVLKDPLRDTDLTVGQFSENNPGLLNFAPRLSISWSPGTSGRTNVSAGFGVYHDQVLGYTSTNRKNSEPFYRLVNNPNFDSSELFPDALAAAGDIIGQVQITDYYNMKTPMVLRYNFSVRRQIPGGWNVQAAYTGARGNHLFRRYERNQYPTPITEPDGSLLFPPDQGAVNPAFGPIIYFSTDAQSFYNAAQVSVGRNVGRRLSLQAGYTYSKSVDDASGPEWGGVQYGLLRTLERGLSDFDLRHRFVFNYFYSLPFGAGLGGGIDGILRKAFGGWRVGGIASLRAGTPFTPEVNIRAPGYLFSAIRPDLAPGGQINPTEGATAGCGNVGEGRTLGGPELYFDPCAFAAPAPGRLGNLGRNTVIAPRVFSMDFSLQREFLLDATKRLQFRAEIFNLPNHTNFGPVSGNALRSSPANPPAAPRRPGASTTPGPRPVRFSLRCDFPSEVLRESPTDCRVAAIPHE